MQLSWLSEAKPTLSQYSGGRGHCMSSWGLFHFSALLFFLAVSQGHPVSLSLCHLWRFLFSVEKCAEDVRRVSQAWCLIMTRWMLSLGGT